MLNHRHIILLLAGLTLFNILFIGKALHIDDAFTVCIAKAIIQSSIDVPQVFSHNPILLGYYYAPIVNFLGEQEQWLHLFYLPFTLLAVLGMYFLSIRFAEGGLLPVALLVVSPAFILTSHGIMLDMPLLAFFLLSLACFIYGTDRDDQRLVLVSSLLAGMTALVKYSGLMLIPLMVIYSLLRGKKNISFVLVPLAMFLLWCVHNMLFYRSLSFLDALASRARALTAEELLLRVLSCLSLLSGTALSLFYFMPLFLRRKEYQRVLFFSFPVTLVPFLLQKVFNGYTLLERSFLALLFLCSCFFIAVIFGALVHPSVQPGVKSDGQRVPERDRVFLALWFIVLLVFTVVSQFLAARFVLLLFPPLLLFAYRECRLSRPLKKGLVVAACLILAISAILAVGDYRFAGVYRDFVLRLKAKVSDRHGIAFCYNSFFPFYSWGYGYYLYTHFRDAMSVDIEAALKKGGLLYVVPREPVLPLVLDNSCPRYFSEMGYERREAGTVEYRGRVTLQHTATHAGFYSHGWGLLPYSVRPRGVILERFALYSLSKR